MLSRTTIDGRTQSADDPPECCLCRTVREENKRLRDELATMTDQKAFYKVHAERFAEQLAAYEAASRRDRG